VVTDEYALSAWGEQRSSTGSTANSQIYKGQFLAYYNDPDAGPETSIYSTHHRYYSAKQKQFTSNDPSESDINSSRYVKNNPINEVDPSGLEKRTWSEWFFGPSKPKQKGHSESVSDNIKRYSINLEELSQEPGLKIRQQRIIRNQAEVTVQRRYRKTLAPLKPLLQTAEIGNAFVGGLMIGSKAVVNGTATAIVNTVTLGMNEDSVELIEVTEEDRRAGYDTAVAFSTAGGEILIGVLTGGAAAALSKGGKVARLSGGGIAIFDAAGNGVGFVKGSYDISQNGLTTANALQVLGTGFGIAGNVKGLKTLKSNKTAKTTQKTPDKKTQQPPEKETLDNTTESLDDVDEVVVHVALPDLPDGYHYRTVGKRTQVVRNPGRSKDLPAMHLEDGQLRLGPSPSVVRNTATRNGFLRSLTNDPNVPKSIRPWLRRGEVPPGYTVHHKKAIFDGGSDTIDNMVLQGADLHTNTHRFYRPGGQIPSINPRPNSFQSN